jgi:hypothetical protein
VLFQQWKYDLGVHSIDIPEVEIELFITNSLRPQTPVCNLEPVEFKLRIGGFITRLPFSTEDRGGY